MSEVNWVAGVFGFVGATCGGTLAAIITARGTRRQRLEKAYADLAGSATLLVQLSIPAMFSERDLETQTDSAWVRFGACRAHLQLQQQDDDARRCLRELAVALKGLYTKEYTFGPDVDEEQERIKQSVQHITKLDDVEGQLEQLLRHARQDLESWS